MKGGIDDETMDRTPVRPASCYVSRSVHYDTTANNRDNSSISHQRHDNQINNHCCDNCAAHDDNHNCNHGCAYCRSDGHTGANRGSDSNTGTNRSSDSNTGPDNCTDNI